MSLVATFDVETTPQGDADESVATANQTQTKKSDRRNRLRHSIYLGGKADAKDYDKLVHRWKITHVLNCTPPKQTNIEAGVPNYFENPKLNKHHKRKRLVYHRVPVFDSPTSLPELKALESDIVRFVAKGLCHGNVLVHCSRGISRSTTSVVLYLMAKRQFRCADALALIRRRRPEAQPIPAFDGWLRERDLHYWSKRQTTQSNHFEERKSNANGNGNGNADEPSTKSSEPTETEPRLRKKPKMASAGGTSIGPAPPPPPRNPKGPSAAMGPSIGPSPPPGIGPELPPRATATASPKCESIGPELPPPAIEKKNNKKRLPGPSIGPELPP